MLLISNLALGARLLWKVLVDVVSKSCGKVFTVAEALENKVHPVIELSFHSSSSEGLDHDALWPSLVERGSPACSTRSETVVDQVCERVRLQSDRPDMTSMTLPRFSRTRTVTIFT